MAYIYCADIWCDDCGEQICQRLQADGKAPANPADGHSYDSNDYPKPCGDDEESDSPQHCAAGEECLNAIELPSGHKIGCIMGTLTPDGEKYVKEYMAEDPNGEVVQFWAKHYRAEGYDLG